MTFAIIPAEMVVCTTCEGTGHIRWFEPYTGETIPRICYICCSYGTLDGARFELFNEKTAGFKVARLRAFRRVHAKRSAQINEG